MVQLIEVLLERHEVRLLGLSLLIGVLASVTAVDLLQHARASAGRMRAIWLCVGAAAGGFGLWGAHFIARLSFQPGGGANRDAGLALVSMALAMIATGASLRAALLPCAGAPWLAGTLLGLGLAAVHCAGLVGPAAAGLVSWHLGLLLASALAGSLVCVAAFALGLREDPACRSAAALLLILAVGLQHFLGLAALDILTDPAAPGVPAEADARAAVSTGFASLTLLVLAFTAITIDGRVRRRREQQELVHSLANAAVEGIAVCDGDRIVTVNTSLADLLGCAPSELIGRPVASAFPEAVVRRTQDGGVDQVIETELRDRHGIAIPVEVILRAITFANRPHHAVAVRDLRARRQAEQHIQFLAHHDALTGLPNRARFTARLDQEIARARATGGRLAVLCLDLDRFKEVNDLYGHAAGDALLRTVARWVPAELDERQSMARLGGDEFAVILPEVGGPAEAGRLAARILEAIRAGNAASDGAPPVATSIGIALYPDDATDRETLLSHADAALYCAKSEGRGTYRYFEAALAVQIRDRRTLEHDLRQAIGRGEFVLLYQPQMEVDTGLVVGFEALLRWNHPGRGSVPPDRFIPIAEETGAILAIGEWVLRETCREAARWERPLRVAVNVSAVQLHSPAFAQLVQDVLAESGIDPVRLELEITETALIRDPARALATLGKVKALGVRIAMDDFGTGYASLSNLRAFPFDKIKIDRSFIHAVDINRETAAIMRAVLGLGRGLGLPVLAEGVETGAELAFLGAEACQEAQGFLLGRPAPIEEFREHTRLPADGARARAA
ncbi:putative signaling protein [Methylobacterium crusticola]|uniref:Signaling protein n=1 Tax=Methylobacterium crusticola TaxID=1697972 RepID=A0ABQ4QTQ3_9HYPH|nr:EAL domain-containing protein [Methylobacterium crusticola]GJD48079.1 putative signaling protein [Methylobacterium crusticola]